MFNLTKMNFYRLFHSKSFYILLGIAALMAFLTLYLFLFMLGMSAALAAAPDEEIDIAATLNVMISVPELFDFITAILLLLCGIGAAFIAHAEDKNGYIKNIAGQVCPRGIQAAAKLPVLLFEILTMYAAVLLVFFGFALFRKMVVIGSVPELLKTVGVHLLLFLAFDTLVMLLTFLTKKTTAGIVFTVFAITNMLDLVYKLLNCSLHKYLHIPSSFDIANFALDPYISRINAETGGSLLARGIAVGAVYLAACTAASALIIRKRDI